MFGFCADEANPFGPDQLYVAPVTAAVLNASVLPAQTGLLLPGEGVAGIGCTITLTVPAAPVHPATVAMTEYVPDAAVVAPGTTGFCVEEINPFGPVQEYVAPAMFDALKLNVSPVQSGLLLAAAGAGGVALTVMATVPALLVQPATVTVSEYVPFAASVTLAMEGFCAEEMNPFGPDQLYVAPVTALVERLSVAPVHTGLLPEGEGAAGTGLTVMLTVPALPVQPATVAVTEYVPDAEVVAPVILGFCADEVNPFGPAHEYVAPAMFDALRVSVLPAQMGLLPEAIGAAGVVFTFTPTVPAALAQPATVTVSE